MLEFFEELSRNANVDSESFELLHVLTQNRHLSFFFQNFQKKLRGWPLANLLESWIR